jgi:hypothetical protein
MTRPDEKYEKEILTFLTAHGKTTVGEISRALYIEEHLLLLLLYTMTKVGVVRRDKNGAYEAATREGEDG